MKTLITKLTIIAAICASTFTTLSANAGTLLDFNGGSASTFPGWTWYANGADDFGNPGWRKNDGKWYSSGSNWFPRLFQKGDYGNVSTASIDTTTYAPISGTTPTLKVQNTGGTKAVGYWYSFGDNFNTRGVANASTNRMDFYIKLSGVEGGALDTTEPANSNVHIGTYLCWDGGGLGGESCPTEANGQHYYHYLTVNSGAWLHVQLDQHPSWMRDSGRPANNPASPFNYFQNMDAFYIEAPYAQSTNPMYWLSNINLWQQTQAENENSVTSVWIGYWAGTNKWEVGFNDMSFATYNDISKSKFEIRWSTSPITNANWSSANPIVPEYFRYGSTNSFRRQNPWKSVAWTRFTLPAGTETNNAKIYFAIKDSSTTADGDGHNAPTANIKSIDYNIRPTSSSSALSPLSPPSNLKIVSPT